MTKKFNYAKATPAQVGRKHEAEVIQRFNELRMAYPDIYELPDERADWRWAAEWVRKKVREAIKADRAARGKK